MSVAVVFQKFVVFIEFRLAFLLLAAEIANAVFQTSDGGFDVFYVFFAFFHYLFDFSEIRHQFNVDVFADVFLGKMSEVDISIDYLKEILPQVVVDWIVLAVEIV